jgi:hypothetical protein
VHIKKNHKDVRVTDDFLMRKLHLNRPNEHLNIDAEFDDIEALRPVERECYKEKVVSLLLKFFSNSSIPQSFTEDIMQTFVEFLNTLRCNYLFDCRIIRYPP